MKNILGKEESLELYNKQGQLIYEYGFNSEGYYYEYTYDYNGKLLTYKDSDGYSEEYTYDSDGNELTYEDSKGERRGFDVPEYTTEQLVEILKEKLGNFKIINK